MTADLLLVIALIGILSSTVVLIFAILGAIKFRGYGRRDRLAAEKAAAILPPVSVLKPVHGAEVRLKENLESFFRQDYPNFEILFAADDTNDAALPIIEELRAKYPNVACRVLILGQPKWPNAPNWCFHHLTTAAAYDILVTSDSDVEVAPNYLREVVPPMLDPKVGALTCVFRGKSAGGFWSDLDAIGMSVEFTNGVLMSELLDGTHFGLGPTIVVRKDSMGKIGGYEACREYLSNDYVVGNFIYKTGYEVVLSGHVVDHVAPVLNFHQMWERQLRWAMGTRYSRPLGHLGSGLTFSVPYGILALVACLASGRPVLGVALFAATLVNRMIECWVIGWWAARDEAAKRWVLLYPVRDIYGFVVWAGSYIKQKCHWRDNNYVLLKGGRLVARRANGDVINPN
jgi:ceramide glucosyltransferase